MCPQIGVPGQSGHLDAGSPVIALVKWVGALDISTSYLGRWGMAWDGMGWDGMGSLSDCYVPLQV